MEQKTGTALAVRSAPRVAMMDTDGTRFYSTIPKEQKAKIVRYLQGKVTPLADMIGKRIKIAYVLAHDVELLNEKTGELEDAVRIVLVTKEGVPYQAVSLGVFKSIRHLNQFYGESPWDGEDGRPDAIEVEVNQHNGKGGHRFFTLDPVE